MGLNSFGLDAFFTCAQEKNFTRAAKRLHLTQSALSQRIKNLEDELGVTLFIRDRLGVRLTSQGEMLLRYCHTRAQLEQEVVSEVTESSQDISGLLRVGGFSSVMRSLALKAREKMGQKHKRIQFHLLSKEIFELPELLRNATADFILLDNKLERQGLQALLLGYEANVRIRKKNSDFTGFFLDHDERDETTINYLKLKSGSKIKRHFMDDIYGIIDGVQAGLGDAIAPLHLIENIKGLEVIETSRVLKSPVYLHFHDRPVQTRLHGLFIESLKKEAESILSQ